jgi:hypothetical protein
MPVSASFPLLPEPTGTTPATSARAEAEAPARGTGNEFLGFGLLRPFRRDLKADFASDGGERVIRSAVGQILCTMAGSEFTQGELPWRPSSARSCTCSGTSGTTRSCRSSRASTWSSAGGRASW